MSANVESQTDLHQIIELCYRSSLQPEHFTTLLGSLNEALAKETVEPHWGELIRRHLQMTADMASQLKQQSAENPEQLGPDLVLTICRDGSIPRINPAYQSLVDELGLHDTWQTTLRRSRQLDGVSKALHNWLQQWQSQGNTVPAVLDAFSELEGRRTLLTAESSADGNTARVRRIDLELALPVRQNLQQMFGLSVAEMEILQMLVFGLSVTDISVARSRSEHTIRTQIKQLLQKTRCRTQTELVQLATSMLFLLKTKPQATESSVRPRAVRTVLSADAELVHFEWGAADGTPWVYLHSALLGPQLPAMFHTRLEDAGIRLLALARPGYAGSFAPDDADDPTGFAALFANWLDRLGLEQIPILASVVGAMHAHMLATEQPARIEKLLLCGGIVPLHSGPDLGRLPMSRYLWWQLARKQPQLLMPLARLGQKLLAGDGAEGFLEMAYKAHGIDFAAIRDPELQAGFLAAAQCTLDAGDKPFVSQVRWQCRDWSSWLHHGVSTRVLHGEKDDIVPVAQVQQIYSGLTSASIRILPNAGQLLLWQCFNEVVMEMTTFADWHTLSQPQQDHYPAAG